MASSSRSSSTAAAAAAAAAADVAAATSSPSVRKLRKKHEVFISFRGLDSRGVFVSHLHKALTDKKIVAYKDDIDLARGEVITPALDDAIKQSEIGLVVFSKDYISSSWCLDELDTIVRCKEENDMTIIPVFFHIEPNVVGDPKNENYVTAFKSLEEGFDANMIQKWKTALDKASGIAGTVVPEGCGDEAKFVQEIVGSVWEKLHEKSPIIESTDLIGVSSRIREIESMLCLKTNHDIRILRIWGMGGCGKSALAEAVFNKLRNQFDRSYFLRDVRHEVDVKKLNVGDLKGRFISALIGEEGRVNIGPDHVRYRLGKVKVLLVLDDVKDSVQLKNLLGGFHLSFHPGSRILVTSRDKKVLEGVRGDDGVTCSEFDVKELKPEEGLELFGKYAFKEKNPPGKGFEELAKRVVDYTKCHPKALRDLGTALQAQVVSGGINDENQWVNNLVSSSQIQDLLRNTLRISYDELSKYKDQQGMFLDIACFFRGQDEKYVRKIFEGCYESSMVDSHMRTLVDKSLITISHDQKIEMHDLMQKMGWQIVRDQPMPSRLRSAAEIYAALKGKKGTEAIEGMFLNISDAKEMDLRLDDPNVFKGFDELRLLKFYVPNDSLACNDKVRLVRPGGSKFTKLDYLPNKLTYLHWHKFPSKSIPQEFTFENLVELNLPRSKITSIPNSTAKKLDKLKRVDLRYSEDLAKIPGLTGAENLEIVILQGCKKLEALPDAFENFKHLEYLDLKECTALKNIVNLKSEDLRFLYLSYCGNIDVCPKFHAQAKLEELDLSFTDISEVPPWIENLKVLKVLRLTGCSKLINFPSVPKRIQQLYLSKTAVTEIPCEKIKNRTKLVILELGNCGKTSSYLPSSIINVTDVVREHYLASGAASLTSLVPDPWKATQVLSGGRKIKGLEFLGGISSLKYLTLSGTSFDSLPETIYQLPYLLVLDLSDCKKLRALEQLPQSLEVLVANRCNLLENLKVKDSKLKRLILANCLKLSNQARNEVVEYALLTIKQMSIKPCEEFAPVEFLLPGVKAVPDQFRDRRDGKDSVNAEVPSDWKQFNRIAFCVVIGQESSFLSTALNSLTGNINKMLCLGCKFSVKEEIIYRKEHGFDDLDVVKDDHVLIWHFTGGEPSQGSAASVQEEDWFKKNSGKKVTFEFYLDTSIGRTKLCTVKSCGVLIP